METQWNIGMGEWKVRPAPGILICMGLGSCVGVVLYDAIVRIGGVAHVMMPMQEKQSRERLFMTDGFFQPAKFADIAVSHMIEKMIGLGAFLSNIKASLFGGANMFPNVIQDEFLDIGKRNIRVIKEELKRHNIRVVMEEIGGHLGRGITLDLASGEVIVKTFDCE